jgi:hypothetical protein
VCRARVTHLHVKAPDGRKVALDGCPRDLIHLAAALKSDREAIARYRPVSRKLCLFLAS